MKPQKAKWQCADGTVIRLCDMTDSHLANAMRMLERQARAAEDDLLYGPAPVFFGEEAQTHFEIEWFDVLENGIDVSRLFPIYRKMEMEVEYRKETFK